MHTYGGFWAFDLFHTLGDVIIVVLIIWFIIWLVGGRRGRMGMWGGPGMWHSHNALNILNERYAKGEINKEEYEERKKTLMSN